MTLSSKFSYFAAAMASTVANVERRVPRGGPAAPPRRFSAGNRRGRRRRRGAPARRATRRSASPARASGRRRPCTRRGAAGPSQHTSPTAPSLPNPQGLQVQRDKSSSPYSGEGHRAKLSSNRSQAPAHPGGGVDRPRGRPVGAPGPPHRRARGPLRPAEARLAPLNIACHRARGRTDTRTRTRPSQETTVTLTPAPGYFSIFISPRSARGGG